MVKTASMNRQELQRAIDRLPRIPLAVKPTPLEDCKNLTKALGGPRILVKREDLTGLGFGGNKVRHMEFCMADALAKGADVSINANLPMSNNSRIIGAAAIKAGLRFVCVVPKGKGRPLQGNMLIYNILGAELHLLDTADVTVVNNFLRELEGQEREKGHKPYVHDFEPMSRVSGSIGYLETTLELAHQLDAEGVQEPHIYLVTGASHGGLVLGTKVMGLPWKITGVQISPLEVYFADVLGWANGAAERLGLTARLTDADVHTVDHTGPGYGIASPECIEAIHLVARTEGIILEPIYTGKAMAAVIDHIRKGILTSRDTVVFIHTGGLPELFNYSRELTQDLPR